MENSKNVKIENAKVDEKKVKDEINVHQIKINLQKGKKDLLTKTKSISKKGIYKGTDKMSSDEQKEFRRKLRSKLHSFTNQILGKDRSDSEREKSVKEFISFYKENWSVCDFKIENFTQTKNEVDKKDYLDLLNYVKSIME